MDRNELWLEALEEYEKLHGGTATNMDDMVQWAIQSGKYKPPLKSVASMARRELGQAVRQLMRRDKNGILYRAKQIVKIVEDGQQMSFVFDLDNGGTDSLRRQAVRQRRDGIAAAVYRAKCDVDRMNDLYPSNPIQFRMDFTDDVEERRAEDQMKWKEEQDKKVRKVA